MEDFGSVLWVILIGAAALFSAVNSNGRKRREAATRGRRTADVEQTQRQTPPPVPFGIPEKSATISYSSARTNNFTCEFENLPETTEAPEQPATRNDEFDLRKAVVYSEILKPKFED